MNQNSVKMEGRAAIMARPISVHVLVVTKEAIVERRPTTVYLCLVGTVPTVPVLVLHTSVLASLATRARVVLLLIISVTRIPVKIMEHVMTSSIDFSVLVRLERQAFVVKKTQTTAFLKDCVNMEGPALIRSMVTAASVFLDSLDPTAKGT